MVFLEKKFYFPYPPGKRIKPQRISTIAQPHLSILFKIFLASPPFKKRRQRLCTLHDRLQRREWDCYHSIWQISFLQNCKKITLKKKKKAICKMIYLMFQVSFIFLTKVYYKMNFLILSRQWFPLKISLAPWEQFSATASGGLYFVLHKNTCFWKCLQNLS